MPHTVALVHKHVVHVDGHPYIRSGIGDFVVHMRVDQEVVGLHCVILNVVDAWSLYVREIEFHIVIFIVGSPWADLSLVSL